jgi:hypothetical protein
VVQEQLETELRSQGSNPHSPTVFQTASSLFQIAHNIRAEKILDFLVFPSS